MRQMAGLSGPRLAVAMKQADPEKAATQATLSRVESGVYPPKPHLVELWRTVCLAAARERAADESLTVAAHREVTAAVEKMASPQFATQLDQMLASGAEELVSWQAVHRGSTDERAGHADLLQTARQITYFAPLTLPAALTPGAGVTPSCPVMLLITEDALKRTGGDTPAVRAHLGRLAHDTLEVRILPHDTPWPRPLVVPFAIYYPQPDTGPATVVIDTYHAQIRLTDPADVRAHEDAFAAFTEGAQSPAVSLVRLTTD